MDNKIPVVLCSAITLASCAPREKEEKLPNIIYILADDLGYSDLSCYGQRRFTTPNIDRLAQEGMLFTQHYAGSTVSAPSRSALMTGMHTGKTPIRGNRGWEPEGQWPLPENAVTVAEVLKTKGYRTGGFGKWGLGFIDTEGDPNKQGFDEFFGFNCQSLAHNYYPYYLWHNHEKVMLPENEGTQTGVYAPDIIQKAALDFIDTNHSQPFFLYYPNIIPHAELFAREENMALFRGKFDPEKEYEGVDEGPNYRRGPYGSQPESHAAFAAMIKHLDDYVGEILQKLDELELEDNTIVIFTSDNGPHLEGGADPDYFKSNGEFRGYKRDLYEGGIRVPMLVRWPGKIKPGSVTGHVSAFWDVMPTIAEITGAQIPEDIDGISFLPTLMGKKQESHDYLYWEFHEQGGKMAVRFGNWKAVKLNINKTPQGETELYDLSSDFSESENIAASRPDLVEKAEELFRKSHIQSEIFPFAYEKETVQQ